MYFTEHARRAAVPLIAAVLFVGALSGAAAAGPYSQLQVLLPGESAAPGTGSGKVGTPDAQTAGIPFDVVVRACDDQWETVTSVTNLVSLSSSDESADLPGTTALQAGEIISSVTLNAGGSFTVSATDGTDGSIPVAGSAPFTVHVLQGFEFARINQKNQDAGVPMAIEVTAVDATGDEVTGFSGEVNLRQITSFGIGRITPEVITLSNGYWAGDITNYRADETSINRGNVNIEAFLPSNPAINGISDPFVVHPGSFSRVQIVAPGQSPLPGSVSGLTGTPAAQAAGQSFSVEVFSTDPYWNPIPSSDVVRVTSSDTGASTPVSGSLSGGFTQLSLSLATVGGQTLTVTDQSNGSIQSMTTEPIVVIPAGPDHFLIDPVPSPIMAGDPTTVTIRAVDASDNLIPDYSGDAFLSANTGPGSIAPESVTFANGTWTGTVIFRGAGGAVSFTCSDFASPPHTGTSNNFVVQPGAYAALQILLPGESPQGGTDDGVSGVPDDQNAGTSFDLRIRAVDGFWNLVPGVESRVVITSSDPFAALPSDTTLTNGELVLPTTLFAAGVQDFAATDQDSVGITDGASSTVNVFPGPHSRILIVAPGESFAPGAPDGRTGTATDQSINFAFTVTVYATDAWWNPVPGVTDMVRITSTDPLATLPADAALIDGQVDLNVRFATGGFQQLTATDLSQPGLPASTTQVRAISSGFHLEAEVTPTEVQAGEPFTLTVRVVNDAGSVIQEINSSVTVEAQHASSREPGRGTLFATEFQLLQGERSVSETYTFAEPIVLVVSDDAGNAPAVTEVVTVDPGPPAQIRLTSDPAWVRGNATATLIATVLDAFDNGVSAQPVDFQLFLGRGTLTVIDVETGPEGTALAEYRSGREPEIAQLRATSNGLHAFLDLETALVDPGMAAGELTSYPNPFHPGEIPATVAYRLADNATVRLRIFTLSGGLVLDEQFVPGALGGRAGLNEFIWDGRNGNGRMVSSGTYILRIDATGGGETLHVMQRKLAVIQ